MISIFLTLIYLASIPLMWRIGTVSMEKSCFTITNGTYYGWRLFAFVPGLNTVFVLTETDKILPGFWAWLDKEKK